MHYLIEHYIPYILSVLTIYSMILAGKHDSRAWSLSLLNQMLWLIWICTSAAWGLLPMNIALWVVYFRNYLSWRKQ